MIQEVTDLDHLVALGYEKELCRQALKLANGDYKAAMAILRQGDIKKHDLEWRKNTREDWIIDGSTSRNVPTNVTNRALHFSPIYISVAKGRFVFNTVQKSILNFFNQAKGEGVYEYYFDVNVTIKDGRQYRIEKSFSDFKKLKASLPLGTTRSFKNSFPSSSINEFNPFRKSDPTQEMIENRRNLLNEWIRELTLSEICMNQTKVIEKLYKFIEIDQHGGVMEGGSMAVDMNHKKLQQSKEWNEFCGPLRFDNDSSREATRNHALYMLLPTHDPAIFPVALHQYHQLLPFKMNLKTLKCVDTFPGLQNPDGNPFDQINLKQLYKDFQRDRIIIQGLRIEGSQTSLDDVIRCSKESISLLLTQYADECNKKKEITRHSTGSKLDRSSSSSPKNIVSNSTIGSSHPVSKSTSPLLNDEFQHQRYRNSSSLSSSTSPTATSVPKPPPIPTVAAPFFDWQLPPTADELHDILDLLVKSALQLISRTESAFTTHTSLLDMIDLSSTTMTRKPLSVNQDVDDEMNDLPYTLVPESSLADPLKLDFLLQVNENYVDPVGGEPSSTPSNLRDNSPWHIVCEAECSTVFRVIDSVEAKTILQLKTINISQLHCYPIFHSSPSSRVKKLLQFELRVENVYIVYMKDTTTTMRDWGTAS